MDGRHTLGLDIGSNSVGSAWIDLKDKSVLAGVSVFPAGVDETEEARGAPNNQKRRAKRSLRRSLARRAARKRALRQLLTRHGLLPVGTLELQALFTTDPWPLRREALRRPVTPHEFGRILVHLGQRRGALGLNLPQTDEDQSTEQPPDSSGGVIDGANRARQAMAERGAETFGELIALVAAERRFPILDAQGHPKLDASGLPLTYGEPVRNRNDSFEFHADRTMIHEEFSRLWERQRSFDSPLAALLTPQLREALDNPVRDSKWKHQGALFGQRNTYWNTGTLGRCDLEPSDRCVPIADRHASYFRVLETVNNIRLRGPGDDDYRPLTETERAAVLEKLRSQRSGTIPSIRAALKIDKRALKKLGLSEEAYKLNIAGDDDRSLNGDWFHAAVVLEAVGLEVWQSWPESSREGLNRALLKFDPEAPDDEPVIANVGRKLGLDEAACQRLVAAWQRRPKLEQRLKLSRRAVVNLLPYMEQRLPSGRWPTQIEARRAFAADLERRAEQDRLPVRHPVRVQAQRYALGATALSKADRRFVRKHGLLPPAPMLANPVVRKAIHEVRRHLIAHIRQHGCKPDRIVIEFARETTKPKKLSDKIYFRNQNREKIRRKIIEEIIEPAFGSGFRQLSHNQLRAAVDRVLLCMQQRGVCAYSSAPLDPAGDGPCAYSGRPITFRMAALGDDLEVDHILPYSRCGDNSLNNRVLCFRPANRNKGRKTPREWWGDQFDNLSGPMRFLQEFQPNEKVDYFERRDYQAKWRNFSAVNVPDEWKGSQLTDTAYAARQVQAYLQQALWPDEPSHLEGGPRRIFVTKGRYTAILRKDWQLYLALHKGSETSPEAMRHAQLKNRGDHREHALDAVVIALTDGERIQELARRARLEEEERVAAEAQGRNPRRIEKRPIAPPWGDVRSFRRQVLTQVYGEFEDQRPTEHPPTGLIVSHRPVGQRLSGAFHEETLLGPVPNELGSDPNETTLFVSKKKVADLDPNHLRLPRPESADDAIERIAARIIQRNEEPNPRKARQRAKALVKSPGYTPRMVDPPPGKSGLVRDLTLRKVLRAEIERRLKEKGIPRDADSFTASDLGRLLKDGPLRMPSGVPIKRITLLRTMNDPVLIKRRKFDYATGLWRDDECPRAMRAYLGGNNHHIEIREDAHGRWSGDVVRTYKAAQRLSAGRSLVDRSFDEARGGRFVMSLAQGDTVLMRSKEGNQIGYFVVFKLDKPQTIQFKRHWDARKATGEKDEEGRLLPDSKRDEMPVTAAQLKVLAPPGEATPIKVAVDPLGGVRRLEPQPPVISPPASVDPRVMEIARRAIAARSAPPGSAAGKGQRIPGSWAWMHAQLEAQGLGGLRSQLTLALRILRNPESPAT